MPHLSTLSDPKRRVGELTRTIHKMQIKDGLDDLALEELKLNYSESMTKITLLKLRIDMVQKHKANNQKRAGKFLIWRGDKNRRVHVIETVADLSAISTADWQSIHVFLAAGLEIDTVWLGRKSVNAENRSASLKVGFINVTSLSRHIEPVKQLFTGDHS